jgi:hypothetical protein
MSKRKRLINSTIATIVCSVLSSLIIYLVPGFGIPPFIGDTVTDAFIFVLGELALWFILWYLVFSMRDKIRRAMGMEDDGP